MDEEPLVCSCGGEEFDYGMVMFPMVWAAVCQNCGAETICHLKIDKPKPPPDRGGWIDPFGFFHPY